MMIDKEEAEKLMEDFVKIVNLGEDDIIRDFIKKNWNPERVEKKGIHDLFLSIKQMHQLSGELDIYKIVFEEPDVISATLYDKENDDWIRSVLFLTETDPVYIKMMGRRPADTPKEFLAKIESEEEMIEAIEEDIRKLVEKNLFSGVLVIAKKGKILYHKCEGYADKSLKTPNDLDTKFNLGSMNKIFTSVAIAKLVQEEKLSFEDTVSKFLPEFNIDQSDKVKVHHLLTHSSGLGNFFNEEYMKNKDKYTEIMDFLKLIEKEKLAFNPGERFQYSNSGFEVLGAIIEKVSGRSYYDYVREEVFLPAGMCDSDSYRIDETVPNMAQGYTKFTSGSMKKSDTWVSNIQVVRNRGSAAGGGYSTANDLLRFSKALFSYKILNEEFTKNVTTGKVQVEPGNSDILYGYGIGEHSFNEIKRYGHNGGAPGINSHYAIYKPIEYTVIVLSNYDPPAAERVGKKVHSYVISLSKKQ